MNTAKRTMALVLVVCMVFALTVSVSADDHTHSYTETVLKAPTCTANGIAKYACECGEKYYKSIPAAHAEPGADAVTVEPTCAKDGNGFTTLVIGPETKARTDRLRSSVWSEDRSPKANPIPATRCSIMWPMPTRRWPFWKAMPVNRAASLLSFSFFLMAESALSSGSALFLFMNKYEPADELSSAGSGLIDFFVS